MRVKVGNNWFEAQPGQPIMVELNETDKANIADMPKEFKRYAIFADSDSLSHDEMRAWMERGASGEDE